MNNTKKISTNLRALQKAHDSYEELRQNITADLMEICKNLPFSESEICRRVSISRSSWTIYKEKGLPYDKIFKVFEFLNGVKVDNQSVIL